MVEGGFEHFAGLRGKQLVRFADIDRIVGIQTGGGGQGDEVVFEILCGRMKVVITEEDLFATGLQRIIFEMPGFERNQYSIAADYQLHGLEHLFGKRFDLYNKHLSI